MGVKTMTTKVLVTGGAGVIGICLVEKLIKQKFSILVIDIKPCPPHLKDCVTYIQKDVNKVSKEKT